MWCERDMLLFKVGRRVGCKGELGPRRQGREKTTRLMGLDISHLEALSCQLVSLDIQPWLSLGKRVVARFGACF